MSSNNSSAETLELLSNLHPDLAPQYQNFSTLLNHKIYHELSTSILTFFSDPTKTLRPVDGQSNNYVLIYEQVLSTVDRKLNPLTLARIASAVVDATVSSNYNNNNNNNNRNNTSTTATSSELQDYVTAQSILENLLEKLRNEFQNSYNHNTLSSTLRSSRHVSLTNADGTPKLPDGILSASLYTESKIHLLSLQIMEKQISIMNDEQHTTTNYDFNSTKEFLKKNSTLLSELSNSTETDVALVHSAYYQCAMVYRKAIGPPEAFYKEASPFLHYTPLDTLTPQEKYTLATDLSLATLTGEGVYNFGEVVHANAALLQVLQGTENEWLVTLLQKSAMGDVTALQTMSQQYASQIASQPALSARANIVQEKITLLALVQYIFETPSSDRTISFHDIANRIQMPYDQIELIVIRALSLGLIKGSMDQVDGTVSVTWVLPRVLDEAQMADMAGRLGEWAVKVSKANDYMLEHIPTLS